MITSIDSFLNAVNRDIQEAFGEKDYEKAICCTKFLCSFYYDFDYKYYDEVLEEYASKAAKECIGETFIDNADKNAVLFYDKFGLKDRGLANIYIKAMLELGYQVIWCLFENAPDTGEIIKRYSSFENLKFELIPNLSVVDRMFFLQNLIRKTKAYHCFIYTLPTDVECVGVFATLYGDVKKYLINLTDHTFWIGADAIDCSIEFRNVGANISTKYRRIDEKKIAILPYYPEERDYTEYQGMPFSEDEEFVFSGGSAYKIAGSDKYEQIVSSILDKYPELKFVYATNDESDKLNKMEQNYKDRFFVIKERSDLDEVLRHAKFYLSTYPVGGGQMTQYALMNNCVPLCLIDKGNAIANPKSWLLHPERVDFVFCDMDRLLAKVDEIMSEDERMKIEKGYTQYVISASEFKKNLQNIMMGRNTLYLYHKEDVDTSLFHSYYETRLKQQGLQEYLRKSKNKWIKEKYLE